MGEMEGIHINTYCGDDASKWAEKFCEIARTLGHEIDEGWMIGWFANAIEVSCDLRRVRNDQAIREAENRGREEGAREMREQAAERFNVSNPGVWSIIRALPLPHEQE